MDHRTDAARWQRLEEIFHAIADEPPTADTDARLAELSGGDESLANEVRILLAADARLESSPAAANRHLGLRLGSYVIDTVIGRGGMAVVYQAHRADAQFEQRVAVKIMDLRLSDDALVAQFRAERQILASFDHPALTRLLDGGVTPFGEPYLVMEYVEGAPIDQYCNREQLEVAGRLRLFTEVCAGVTFAHRNLVLHRDLKPSNILVTREGRAKIVDFGTAALLQPERLATTSRAPLTPAYASPEQLTGQAVGTASDQYSLGLVLYELLTGVTPFAGQTSLIASVERALAGREPDAPHLTVADDAAVARRTTVTRLRRLLGGDLGTIVRKTLATDPAARYSSVQHFADDLARWLAGEAILGRAPSLVYRTSRFARRHWVAVSVAATLFLSLVAATVVSLQQAAIAREQGSVAQIESAKARQLNRFLTQMLSSANPSWSNANAASAGSITVRQALDGASELIRRELPATPEVEADIRRTLGRTYTGLGAFDQALPHLERALAIYQARNDDFAIAFTRNLLGNVRILQGDFAAAEHLLRDVVAYVRSRGDEVDPELHQIATSDLGNAIAYQRPGDAEAMALMRESIAVADRQGSNTLLSSITYANLAGQLIRLGRIDEAEVALQAALTRMDGEPAPPPEHYSTIRNLAILKFQKGEYVDAERLAREATEGAARTRPADHPLQPNFKVWWGRSLVALGQLDRARPVLLEAYAGYRRLRPPGHLELALPLIGLGELYRLEGDVSASERALREARGILQRNPASRDRGADAAGQLGLTLRTAGKTAEARTLLAESYETLRTAYGDGHPLTKDALARLRESDAAASR
jgi:eukaryotic-like serine/threonine-protein kinase